MVDQNKDKTEGKDPLRKKVDPKKKVKYKRFVLKSFRVSVSIGGYKAGDVFRLSVDKKTGSPREKYWRRRLKDAAVDGCIVAV